LAHIPEKWTPMSGLPDIGALKCANRKHPICVVFRKGYAPTCETRAHSDSIESECALRRDLFEVRQQICNEVAEFRQQDPFESLGSQNRPQPREAFVEITVDQDVVILRPVRNFVGSIAQATRNRLVGVLGASFEAGLELAGRWRQHEYADDVVAHFLIELLRALPVDVEQHVASRRQRPFYRLPPRSLEIALGFPPFPPLLCSSARPQAPPS